MNQKLNRSRVVCILLFVYLYVHITCASSSCQLPLFNAYPFLASHIPYVALRCCQSRLALHDVYFDDYCIRLLIKYDGQLCEHQKSDRSFPFFSGNKIRKLEFMLADALKNKSKTIITFGCAGSNHAVATACYSAHLAMKCICILCAQEPSAIVQRNLLLHTLYGSTIHYVEKSSDRQAALYPLFLEAMNTDGCHPYIIPTGTSCVLGTLGFVNAAFELKQQLTAQSLPAPDIIYVPAGSYGTIAGLVLGVKLAQLPTQVIGIAVEPGDALHAQKEICSLIQKTNNFLTKLCNDIPAHTWFTSDITIDTSYAGRGYAMPTQEGRDAQKYCLLNTSIVLDDTYSAKCFAGMLDHVKKGYAAEKTVLFWQTFCADSYDEYIKNIDYKKKLPEKVYTYFE
jgi:1-aminocyclopropane-1-carboxylate deaminase/D-cysteine desulfhydrase-like pyridoxal-dependent ACC family enzyme